MTGTKVLLIVLILIVVLFVVCVVWGVLNDKRPSYPPRSKLGDLFGSLSPKLKPMELTPDPPPPRRSNVPPAKFIVKTGDQPTTFDVSPDSHHKVRRATFSATTPDCASIEYQTLDGSGADLKLNKQYWPKGPDGSTRDTDHPTKVTFQILSAQGRLTIAFPQPFVPCVVQLE